MRPKPKVKTKNKILKLGSFILSIIILIWALLGVNINFSKLLSGVSSIINIISLMFPPNLSFLNDTLVRIMESVTIAFLGTTIGSVFAVPVAFIAAQNIFSLKIISWAGRQILNAIRTFPTLILAVFFVAAFGPGKLAGLLAVGLHSIGMLGKLYTDVIENIDTGSISAIEASGANKLEVLWYAVFPQILPEFIAISLYRFEINMRASTVLGLVGAGGIGMILSQALNYRRWSVVGMALIVIVIAVTIVDYSSAYLRKKIV